MCRLPGVITSEIMISYCFNPFTMTAITNEIHLSGEDIQAHRYPAGKIHITEYRHKQKEDGIPVPP